MQIYPWIITSWPIVERPAQRAPEIARGMRHLGTVASGECDEFGRLLGHTIWGCAELKLGVAWDWTETLDGVYALSDPMGVVSNIEFVDDAGNAISESLSAVQLNSITHALPWQPEISRAARGLKTATTWRKRARPIADLHFRTSRAGGFAASRM